jgi:hypothetical protein
MVGSQRFVFLFILFALFACGLMAQKGGLVKHNPKSQADSIYKKGNKLKLFIYAGYGAGGNSGAPLVPKPSLVGFTRSGYQATEGIKPIQEKLGNAFSIGVALTIFTSNRYAIQGGFEMEIVNYDGTALITTNYYNPSNGLMGSYSLINGYTFKETFYHLPFTTTYKLNKSSSSSLALIAGATLSYLAAQENSFDPIPISQPFTIFTRGGLLYSVQPDDSSKLKFILGGQIQYGLLPRSDSRNFWSMNVKAGIGF